MDIIDATYSYESWLADQIDVVAADLETKHALQDSSAFVFFRATHYRWLERVLEVAPEVDGPHVLCVGDLHLENFGTWRDRRHRLVWGVNDFDESEELPYTLDLTRLAVSIVLAIDDADLDLDPEDAHRALLTGYADGLADGGDPFVLDGDHDDLAELVEEALHKPAKWWKELEEPAPIGRPWPADEAPARALAAILAVAPAGWHFELRPRDAGVGSRGHRRLVAVGRIDGERAAREVKELSPPAGRWLGHAPTPSVTGAPTVRSADPLRAIRDGWLARRIAPDCVKIDLADLPRRKVQRRLFEWMGRETANIHLGTPSRVSGVRADLAARPSGWLTAAALKLVDVSRRDWKDWKARPHGGSG
jgi:Uncharacterized protein conserved in bacteria (DUF2252)